MPPFFCTETLLLLFFTVTSTINQEGLIKQGRQCFTSLGIEQKESKFKNKDVFKIWHLPLEILREMYMQACITYIMLIFKELWEILLQGIVRYLNHMGRGRILACSNSGGFSAEAGGHAVPCSQETKCGRQQLQLLQLPSPSRCCYGTRMVSEGFNRTQSVR